MSDENINVCINVVTKKSIKEAGDQLDKMGQKGKKAGQDIETSAKRAGKALESIERSSGFAIAGLVALTAAAVKSLNAFKAFETGLINVEKVTNISGKNLASFGDEIDRLARRIPVGTSELLNISQTAGQLGIEGAKNILAFTEAVALLTRTTDLTIDSAQSLAQLIEVSGTAPEDVGRLAAVLVDLGNNFSATESQILDVSTRIAQSTTQFNLLAEDAVKLGAVIAGVGEKAEASGTAIGKTFRALESAITLGGPPLQTLIDLTGLQQEELSRLFESNPTELLRKFTQGLGEAKKAGELVPVILSDFGLKTDRVNRVLGPLIKNTDRVNEAFERTEKQIESQNAAVEEANKQFRSLESQELLTANATNELAKTIGTSLEPAYRSILELTRTVSIQVTRFVEDNGPLLKVLKAGITGIGIAFASIATIATASLLGLFSPIVLLTAKIALLGTAIAGIGIFWDDIALAGKKFALDMLTAIGPVIDSFGKLANLIGISNETIDKAKDSISKYTDELNEEIKAQEESNKKKEEANKLDKIRIEQIRDLEDRQEELREVALRGDGERSIAAQKEIKSIDDQIRKLNDLESEQTKVTLTRIQQIKSLVREREALNQSRETASVRNQQGITREIELINSQIAKLKELQATQEKEKKDQEASKRIEDIIKEEELLQAKLVQVRRIANDKSTDGIQEALTKQTENKLKSLRDEAIQIGDFIAARRAERELDRIDTQRKNEEAREKEREKAVEAEQKKQQELLDIKNQFRELETERKELEVELQFIEDEQIVQRATDRIQTIEILKLEAQKREQEAEGNHLLALETQRKIDDKKRLASIQARSDAEIRQDQATAQVKRVVAQTSSQQIIGIGDNLVKAGILQGKTAGKALKTLKTGEALVNTYAGANLALSSSPPPFNFIAAASVIANGLANIVQIQSQKFATGGIVQPVGTASRGIDNVPALLSVGEEVLTKNNPRHKDNISKEQDQALLEAINGLRGDIQAMEMSVNIDGKEVADVIQQQRFRGVR